MKFQSCDRIIFKVFRKDLETFSHGFSMAVATTDIKTVIPLTETGAVLDLLFQFTSLLPEEYPDVHLIEPFQTFMGLAGAAQKYQVPAANAACKLEMR